MDWKTKHLHGALMLLMCLLETEDSTFCLVSTTVDIEELAWLLWFPKMNHFFFSKSHFPTVIFSAFQAFNHDNSKIRWINPLQWLPWSRAEKNWLTIFTQWITTAHCIACFLINCLLILDFQFKSNFTLQIDFFSVANHPKLNYYLELWNGVSCQRKMRMIYNFHRIYLFR